jgi:rod shape determining protein RodA
MEQYKYSFLHMSGLSKLLLLLLSLLFILGFLMQYSASSGKPEVYAYAYLLKLALGLIIMFLFYKIDLKIIFLMADYFYYFSLSLLALVPIIGITKLGAQRWLNLGFIVIQPSEIMKLALILVLAKHFHQFSSSNFGKLKFYIKPIILTLLPFLLIVIQPDLGTALLIIILSAFLFLLGGFQIKYFAMAGALVLIITPIMWFGFMHDYQKQRVLTFLDPYSNPLGSGYQIIQSQIAIGSGGFLGKGLLQGTQGQLDFLPEKHTDFIFTILAEELGFLGVLFLLGLYTGVLLLCAIIANKCIYNFGKFIIMGVASTLFIYIFVNIGMVSGLLPVVGVPLPFISFGGTSLISAMIGFGLILNIENNESYS